MSEEDDPQSAGHVSKRYLVQEFGPGIMEVAPSHPFLNKIERRVKYYRLYSDNTIEWEYEE